MTTIQRSKSHATLLIGLSFIAFVSLGLPDGLIGVGWPSIRANYNLPLDALGPLLITFTTGYLLSSFASGRVLGQLGVGRLLALSCFGTAASLLGYGFSPVWWVMVGFGLVSGFGAGAIDAGLNTYAAHEFDARTVNWLHACFGVGSATGPLVMTAVLNTGQSWRLGFVLVGTVQLVLATCFWFTRARWDEAQAEPTDTPQQATTVFATLRLPQVWIGIVLFAIYTGTEVTVGQWAYSLLTEARGVLPVVAGIMVSIYWASLTVGRIVFGGLAGSRVSLATLLRGCFLLVVLGAAFVWLDAANWLSFFGIAFMGFGLAPVFPSLIATTPARLGPSHAANAIGFQVAAASLGGAALPSLVGVLARTFGLNILGVVLFVAALLLLGLYQLLVWTGNQPTAAS